MKSYSNLVVVIPAYNEEKRIAKTVSAVKKITRNIIVVDDGSTDNTHDVAKKVGAVVLRHATNRGKGEALKTAFRRILKMPKIKYVSLIDADMQFRPYQIPAVVKPLQRGTAEFVMGKRSWSDVPLRHALGNFVWRTIFNLLYGTRLKDTNCGLMAMSKNILPKLEVGGGYIIENMMLASAVRKNIKIEQVPVRVDYHVVHGLSRGARVVSGVLIYIIKDGLKYRLSKVFK